jgi:hypothetical protein
VTDLKLKLLDTFLYSDDVLLEGGLIVLELSDLLLKTGALGLLVIVVTLDLLLNAVKLVGQSLARILLLHGQDALKSLFLTAKDLSLLLVSVELLLKGSYGVIQVVQLALKVSGVVGAASGHVWRGHHGLNVEAASSAGTLLSVSLG